MLRLLKRAAYELRWWRWFLFGKNGALSWHIWQFDKPTRKIIYQRWADAEPTFDGLYVKHRTDCPHCKRIQEGR